MQGLGEKLDLLTLLVDSTGAFLSSRFDRNAGSGAEVTLGLLL